MSGTGSFCADPLTITVRPVPVAVDSVTGEDTVCLNRVYGYHAYADTAGAIFSWEAVGGEIVPSAGITEPDGTHKTCYRGGEIDVPPALTVDFTYSISPVCTKVPVVFTPVLTGAGSYNATWKFGDNTVLEMYIGQREYTWAPSFNPNNFTVKLYITDRVGCHDSATHSIAVWRNDLNGSLGGNETVCSSAAPYSLT